MYSPVRVFLGQDLEQAEVEIPAEVEIEAEAEVEAGEMVVEMDEPVEVRSMLVLVAGILVPGSPRLVAVWARVEVGFPRVVVEDCCPIEAKVERSMVVVEGYSMAEARAVPKILGMARGAALVVELVEVLGEGLGDWLVWRLRRRRRSRWNMGISMFAIDAVV